MNCDVTSRKLLSFVIMLAVNTSACSSGAGSFGGAKKDEAQAKKDTGDDGENEDQKVEKSTMVAGAFLVCYRDVKDPVVEAGKVGVGCSVIDDMGNAIDLPGHSYKGDILNAQDSVVDVKNRSQATAEPFHYVASVPQDVMNAGSAQMVIRSPDNQIVGQFREPLTNAFVPDANGNINFSTAVAQGTPIGSFSLLGRFSSCNPNATSLTVGIGGNLCRNGALNSFAANAISALIGTSGCATSLSSGLALAAQTVRATDVCFVPNDYTPNMRNIVSSYYVGRDGGCMYMHVKDLDATGNPKAGFHLVVVSHTGDGAGITFGNLLATAESRKCPSPSLWPENKTKSLQENSATSSASTWWSPLKK